MRKIYKKSDYKYVVVSLGLNTRYMSIEYITIVILKITVLISTILFWIMNMNSYIYTCLVVHLGNPLTVQSYIFTMHTSIHSTYISLKFIVSLK